MIPAWLQLFAAHPGQINTGQTYVINAPHILGQFSLMPPSPLNNAPGDKLAGARPHPKSFSKIKLFSDRDST